MAVKRGSDELQMLRRRARPQILAAIFLEARRGGNGGPERDAGVPAARRSGDSHAEQEAARGALPARRGGWIEYRGALRRVELLPPASFDCHSAAKARRRRRRDRSRWIFWFASEPCAAGTAVSQEPAGDCARRRIAGPDALAFRCAGLHGIRYAG